MTSRPVRLLVVDDDPDVVYSFTRVFREPDYHISEARSGEQALAMLPEVKPDLVLMDVRMPGAGGLVSLTKMRQLGYRMPIVLMTAYGSPQIASQARQAGAADCIIKPFEVPRIRQAVANALHDRGPQDVSTVDGESRSQEQVPVPAPELAGDAIFNLLFDEIARRQPLEEGLDAFDIVERHLILRALEACDFNQSQAARFLGITRNTLRKRIKKYGFSEASRSAIPGDEADEA